METNVLIPSWFMFALSFIFALILLVAGWRLDRAVVAFGVMPFGMLAYYYGVITFSQDLTLANDLTLRLDFFRPALLVLFLYVAVLALNGKLNQLLTSAYDGMAQWLTSRHS